MLSSERLSNYRKARKATHRSWSDGPWLRTLWRDVADNLLDRAKPTPNFRILEQHKSCAVVQYMPKGGLGRRPIVLIAPHAGFRELNIKAVKKDIIAQIRKNLPPGTSEDKIQSIIAGIKNDMLTDVDLVSRMSIREQQVVFEGYLADVMRHLGTISGRPVICVAGALSRQRVDLGRTRDYADIPDHKPIEGYKPDKAYAQRMWDEYNEIVERYSRGQPRISIDTMFTDSGRPPSSVASRSNRVAAQFMELINQQLRLRRADIDRLFLQGIKDASAFPWENGPGLAQRPYNGANSPVKDKLHSIYTGGIFVEVQSGLLKNPELRNIMANSAAVGIWHGLEKGLLNKPARGDADIYLSGVDPKIAMPIIPQPGKNLCTPTGMTILDILSDVEILGPISMQERSLAGVDIIGPINMRERSLPSLAEWKQNPPIGRNNTAILNAIEFEAHYMETQDYPKGTSHVKLEERLKAKNILDDDPDRGGPQNRDKEGFKNLTWPAVINVYNKLYGPPDKDADPEKTPGHFMVGLGSVQLDGNEHIIVLDPITGHPACLRADWLRGKSLDTADQSTHCSYYPLKRGANYEKYLDILASRFPLDLNPEKIAEQTHYNGALTDTMAKNIVRAFKDYVRAVDQHIVNRDPPQNIHQLPDRRRSTSPQMFANLAA
jgi:hypothetical protein